MPKMAQITGTNT